MENFKALREFKKTNWEDIPDYGLYSMQVLTYLEEHLLSYFPDMVTLTSSMINNYVKNGIIPKPVNKKYYRDHIGILMVVAVLKELLPLESIKEGIDLQLGIMGIERAYNEFMDILQGSLRDLLDALQVGKGMSYGGFEADWDSASLTIAIKAFAFQTLTREILKARGIYNQEGQDD